MPKNKNRIHKPVIKWQSGKYAATQQLTFDFPLQFLMLCKLMNVTPAQLLTDFIDNVSRGTWKHEGREDVKSLLTEYFIQHNYASGTYTPEQIRSMFRELDAISLLYPKNAEQDILEAYADWREKFQVYWFNKWSVKS